MSPDHEFRGIFHLFWRLPTPSSFLRPTIVQHLLNDSTDPFNRQPLTEDMLQPQSDLRERIDEFVKRRGAEAAPPST